MFQKQGTEKEVNQFKQFVAEVDKNGDSNLSLKEFIDMMEKFINKK